ncbi:ATP-binding protein [Planomonospora corallina]|uniref:ATP-binding protein n=1 Tax=Planomonospora corallina TaxID=1806052 RepID=A0ABV8I8X0_9ACTN
MSPQNGSLVASDTVHTVEGLLAAAPTSVREARCLVRRELAGWGAGDLIDDCVLIVSELVTNAVRHGGAACALRLGGNGAYVYGELFDPGAGTPRVCEAGTEATGGRGLQIVDALADEWGVSWPDSGGKVVWFLLGGAPAPRGTGHRASGASARHRHETPAPAPAPPLRAAVPAAALPG